MDGFIMNYLLFMCFKHARIHNRERKKEEDREREIEKEQRAVKIRFQN